MSNLLSKEQVLEWHCKVVREAMDYMNKEWPHSHRNMIANHIHNKFTSVISAIDFNENPQPEAPPPASGYSLEQIEKTKLKVANALLRGSAPFAIEIIDELIRELKQLAPAEPKGEVVTVYLHTLEHYNQCDNSITTVEMEYDDTPETFKQIHRFCPEEGELIKACMTLTQIREGDDE